MKGNQANYDILIAFGIAMALHLISAGASRRYVFLDGELALPVRPGTNPRITLQRYETAPTLADNRGASARERPPEEARFASDRNAAARNRAPVNLPRADLPYSRGSDERAYHRAGGGDGREARSGGRGEKAPKSAEGERGRIRMVPDAPGQSRAASKDRDFAAYLRKGGEAERERKVYGEGIPRGVGFRNLKGGVLGDGDLQFSTYDWNFAPYMFRLKERIEARMFPPAAFSLYGLIDGENVVRFRIGRDGKLLGMEVLGFHGSKVLIETSTHALELSDPFPALPPDFPEENLEVTGTFRYIRTREGD